MALVRMGCVVSAALGWAASRVAGTALARRRRSASRTARRGREDQEVWRGDWEQFDKPRGHTRGRGLGTRSPAVGRGSRSSRRCRGCPWTRGVPRPLSERAGVDAVSGPR